MGMPVPVPVMAATIQRRLLVNYRVDPDALARVLPEPFRPQLLNGFGVAGICLIRLGGLRPAALPGRAGPGLCAENAAHRIAVEWDTPEGVAQGVYIPRRDSSSRLVALAGGRLFPGIHHRARFRVQEAAGRYQIAVTASDGGARVRVVARLAAELPPGSVFGSLAAASRFFEQAALGWSATRRPGVYDGIELHAPGWHLEPCQLQEVSSSFFDNPRHFPPGTAEPDSVLLMRNLASTWHARQRLVAPASRLRLPPAAASRRDPGQAVKRAVSSSVRCPPSP